MRLVAFIVEHAVIVRILGQLCEPTRAPCFAPIRYELGPARNACRANTPAARAEPYAAVDELFRAPVPGYENQRQDVSW